MTARKTNEDKLRYEDAIEQLEQLVERIEAGEIGLEESLKQYEHGVKLIQRCRAILDSAEKKIAELTRGEDGELVEEA